MKNSKRHNEKRKKSDVSYIMGLDILLTYEERREGRREREGERGKEREGRRERDGERERGKGREGRGEITQLEESW
jgi:hypothetical protein